MNKCIAEKKKKKQYQRYFLLSRNVTNYLRTYVSLQSLVRCCTFQTSPLLNAKKTLTKREKEKKKKKCPIIAPWIFY